MNSVDSKMSRVSVHRIGNKQKDEYLELAGSELKLSSEISEPLNDYFNKAFNAGLQYQFWHDNGLPNNKLYELVRQLFHRELDFHEVSREIARTLYDASLHPLIKQGDFYVAFWEEANAAGQVTEALGLFKAESRDTILQLKRTGEDFGLNVEEGTSVQKLDKSCIIFNVHEDQGYTMNIYDQTNRGQDAHYWIDEFIGARRCADSYAYTEVNLKVCKDFILKELPEHFDIPKVEQADLLSRSMAYFKESDQFDVNEYSNKVLGEEVSETYKNYRQGYALMHETELPDQFDVSEPAVKKQARVFKSVLKLDKNFHIYIHGDKSLIERGEEDGKKYYKIYFREEQ